MTFCSIWQFNINTFWTARIWPAWSFNSDRTKHTLRISHLLSKCGISSTFLQAFLIWNSCHTSVNIWYSVIIHEESDDSLHSACAVRGSFAKFRIAERAKRYYWRVFSVFVNVKNEKQMRTIEIREVDKEKGRKGSKFTTKVFSKIQINGVTMAMICFHLWWDLISALFWPRRILHCVFTFCTSTSL